VNCCVLSGRVASDPEMRTTTAGLAITQFRLAVKRERAGEGQQDVDFLDIVTFGKTAEFVQRYMDKGAHLELHGRVQVRQWTDQDGDRHRRWEIAAESVQALESKEAAERRRAGKAGTAGTAPHPPTPSPQGRGGATADGGGGAAVPAGDEDPFAGE